MLKHWQKLLATDCRVVEINESTIYPIFKNGSSSLFASADKVLVNNQIHADNVVVFIRDPVQRFIKGVNQYCAFNGLDVLETHERIRSGELMDRHFAPQWTWLFHLYKYHKGSVTLKAMDQIGEHCSQHLMKQRSPMVEVEPLQDFVKPDLALIGHLGKEISLEELVRK